MNTLERLARMPLATLEYTNILLTQGDTKVGTAPKDVVTTSQAKFRSLPQSASPPIRATRN